MDRLDVFRIDSYSRCATGALDVKGRLTRTGVLKYADGRREWREMRPADEVFRGDSLESLKGAPFVIGHPGKITPENWSALAKGHVRDDVRADGDYVHATIRVSDAATIKAIEGKTLTELSCGYSCDVKDGAGEHRGEKYDAVQTNITYNHVGVGGKGWGRAGPEVKLLTDAGIAMSRYDAELTEVENDTEGDEDEEDEPTPPKKAAPPFGKKAAKANAVIPARANDQSTQENRTTLPKSQMETDTKKDAADELTKLRAENDVLKARNDSLEAEVKKLSSAERFDGAVKSRVSLLVNAQRILGSEFKTDGKSDVEIQTEVIKKCEPKLRLDGKDPVYIQATYDIVSARADQSLADQRKIDEALRSDGFDDGDSDGSDAAARRMKEDAQNAWKN